MLEKAIALATKRHEGQKRRSGEDYISHPLAVMEILHRYEFPEEALICAVLHDVCEDTEVSNLHIVEVFGQRIGFMVNQLTKNKSPDMKHLEKEYKALKNKGILNDYESLFDYIDYKFRVYFNRLSVGIYANPLIMFIKMADQIHNFQTMQYCLPHKVHRKVKQVELHYIPLYHSKVNLLSPLYEEKYWLMLEELLMVVEKQKVLLKADKTAPIS